jgi:hypothetical protein
MQISEGPFLSMAQCTGSFVLEPEVMTVLGTWRFGVDSPKYGRQVMVSMIHDGQESEASPTVRQELISHL